MFQSLVTEKQLQKNESKIPETARHARPLQARLHMNSAHY